MGNCLQADKPIIEPMNLLLEMTFGLFSKSPRQSVTQVLFTILHNHSIKVVFD